MKQIGVYLGINKLSVVESDGKSVSNSFDMVLPKMDLSDSIDKQQDDPRLVNGLKEALKKIPSGLDTVTNLVVPGRDLIIRTFYMPGNLTATELNSAVRFEAKKYIPFKLDEMICDYRSVPDKAAKKTFVVFVGIKKDVLEKYKAVLRQVNLKPSSLEYSGFTTLRLLQLAGIKEKEITAVVNVDPADEDEVNFVVLEDGFPLFNRDMILTSTKTEEQLAQADKVDTVEIMEKLKIELRMSLDFYMRKFPTKNIKKIVFMAPSEYQAELDGFIKARGLVGRFVDLKSIAVRPGGFALSFYRAYSAAIAKSVAVKVKVDLLSPAMVEKAKETSASKVMVFAENANFNIGVVLIGVVLCIVLYLFGAYPKMGLNSQINRIKSEAIRSQVKIVSADNTIDEINQKKNELQEKMKSLDQVVKNRLLVTSVLTAIPGQRTEGLWLDEVSITRERLTLIGNCYLGLSDNSKERDNVNNFLSNLNSDLRVTRYFPNLKLNVGESKIGRAIVTNFEIGVRE
jgi:Tfp pilus assembly PilM family ATPase